MTVVFALVALVALLPSAASAGVVPTDKGPVRGTETAAVKQYLGIPYAAPPVGNLRWQPPQPHARWHGPLDATEFENHCPQEGSSIGSATTNEDCLYLNVYAPNRGKGKGHTKNLPVMLWIHGGALSGGRGDDYDPTRLVQQGRIVVTINYRLGWLGFLAHPALTAESPQSASGNYGYMDQQAALRWVKRNIRKFGGDPGNVTIFGQSAGGHSVHVQLASPLAAGLFHRAIAHSGAYADATMPPLSEAEAAGSDVAARVGCADQTAECLRSVAVGDLLRTQPSGGLPVVPPVDGFVLRQSPSAAFASGQFNRVPITEGSTHDEFRSYAATLVPVVPAAFYPIVVGLFTSTLGLDVSADEIVRQYPITDYQNDVRLALSAIGTDYLFSCPGRRAARSFAKAVPTFAYEFNDPNAPDILAPDVDFPFGAYHASELPYLFDSTTLGGHAPFTPDQEQLAAAMVRYWTQFAGTGNPNSPATPEWPAYTVEDDTYQSLEPPLPRPITDYAADHKCAFWDAQD
jgi:para-nitrobenzyl esterase